MNMDERILALAKALDTSITAAIKEECRKSGLDFGIYMPIVCRITMTITELALAGVPDPQIRQALRDAARVSAAEGVAEIEAVFKRGRS